MTIQSFHQPETCQLSFSVAQLKADSSESSEATYPIEFVPEHGWQGNMQEIVIPPESCAIGRAIYELHLPPSYLIVLIHRSGEYLVPNGGMVLQPGDRILGISAPEVQEQVADMFCQPNLPI